MKILDKVLMKNGFVFAFLVVGLILIISYWLSAKLTNKKVPGVAIAILAAMGLAFIGGKKGLSDVPIFAGLALFGGSM